MGGSHVTLDARPGGSFREIWFDEGKKVITSGYITHFNPPWELRLTWSDEDWPGETTVTFSLDKLNEGTRLTLEHSGWEIHPGGRREELIKTHTDGWSYYLKQLSDYMMKEVC